MKNCNGVEMSRAEICEEFLKSNEVNCCTAIDSDMESHFSHSGCDCCGQGGADVYDCNGYSAIHEQIFDLGEVCHECLYYFAIGE
jgi:hypothetical protein